MSDEDKLAASLLTELRDGGVETRVEEHYNHYGDRGVVDVVALTQDTTTLFELKSESAVRNATGANEIIRQAKRHAEYYFEDKGRPRVSTRRLDLVFYLTQSNWDHVVDNMEMYRSLTDQRIDGCFFQVKLRHPASRCVVKPSFMNHLGGAEEYLEYVDENLTENPFEIAGVNP